MWLAAQGIAIELPAGWDGRIFHRAGAGAILHAGSFPLPAEDGDFGAEATGGMPAASTFLVLKEYLPDAYLRPGHGLFAPRSLPLPLAHHHFHPRSLQVTRPGQAGLQHFFTAGERPFCLYSVIKTAERTGAAAASRQIEVLDRALGSLAFDRG